jgi:glycogen debranching enzyme
VMEHEALFGQALSGLLWSRSFYRWDGSSSRAPEWAGTVDARDVLIMPDKWEFPWLASWDTAFHAVTATLIDPTMAADEIRFILSDRWQQPDGHVPCAEWVMADECPPIFAWAAWRIFEAGGDGAFLEGVYPSLARHYAYWWDAKAVEPRGLFTGGFLGMDNLPRGGGRAAQADASAWMALFAADLARIARELGDEAAAERYDADRSTIAAAVDATLWDPETRFYHDLNASGQHLQVPSYSGLVPLIAGIVPAERVGPLLEALRDEDRFLSPGGIRSVDATHPIYTPAYAAGRVNSNWLGPVWVPLQYLLIHALEEVDPALASDVRDRVVTNVKRQWLATGRLWEYYDGDTGVGLGADAQAGWTALVANLIVEGWPAP